jgi:hypothetical protein
MWVARLIVRADSVLTLAAAQVDWPTAAVLLGSLATIALAVAKWRPRHGLARGLAPEVELAEIRARLAALERAHTQMRAEVRADIKELARSIDKWIGR